MARLGDLGPEGLMLLDDDGDQLRVEPILKPSLVLVSIPGDEHRAVALSEEQVRALVEYLQGQLTSRC